MPGGVIAAALPLHDDPDPADMSCGLEASIDGSQFLLVIGDGCSAWVKSVLRSA